MILLLGQSEDDIFYFRERLEMRQIKKIADGFSVVLGKLGSDEFCLCAVGPSNYLSAIYTSYLINAYKPYLVVNVGGATSMKPSLHQGDLLIADRYYLHGVEHGRDGKSIYGQIPSLPPFFLSDGAFNSQAEAAAYAIGGFYVERGYLLSGEKDFFDQKEFDGLIQRHYRGSEKMSAYDNISAGIAMVCSMHELALLTIKVIAYEPGKAEQYLTRKRRTLEMMPIVGRIMTTLLKASQERL